MATVDGSLVLVDGETQRAEEDSRRRDLQLKSERNSLLPISQLPLEIFIMIFQILSLLNPHYVMWNLWNWLTLTRVCRSWRNMALNCPALWTRIRFSRRNKDKVQAFLNRSQNANIFLTFYSRSFSSEVSESFEILLKCMERIQEFHASFDLENNEEWDTIKNLFSHSDSLQKMKKLTLHAFTSGEEYDSPVFMAINNSTLHLEALSLEAIFIPWDSNIFCGLVELNLGSNTYKQQPTLSELLHILENCPNLRGLELLEAGPKDTVLDRKRVIDLNQLENFQFLGTNVAMCNSIFEHLHVPKDLRWSIFFHNYSFEIPELLHPKLWVSTMQCQKMVINLDNDRLNFKHISEDYESRIYQQSKSLSLGWDQSQLRLMQSFDPIFSSIRSIIGQECWKDAKCITFEMLLLSDKSIMELVKKSTWTRFFNAIPHVRTLEIIFPPGTHHMCLDEDAIDAFTEPVNSDSLHNFLYSELKNLHLILLYFDSIHGRKIFDKLVNYLQQYNQSGMRLRTLKFFGCNGISQFLEELKELDIADEVVISNIRSLA